MTHRLRLLDLARRLVALAALLGLLIALPWLLAWLDVDPPPLAALRRATPLLLVGTLALLALALAGGTARLLAAHRAYQQRLDREGTTWLLLPSRRTTLGAEMWQHLASALPPGASLTVTLLHQAGEERLLLRALPEVGEVALTRLLAAHPGLQIHALPDADPANAGERARWRIRLTLSNPLLPLVATTAHSAEVILGTLVELPSDVTGAVEVHLRGGPRLARHLSEQAARAERRLARPRKADAPPPDPAERERIRAQVARAKEPLVEASLHVWATAPSQAAAQGAARGIAAALVSQHERTNPLRVTGEGAAERGARLRAFEGAAWSGAEIATVLGIRGRDLPHHAPHFRLAPAPTLVPDPANLLAEAGRLAEKLEQDGPKVEQLVPDGARWCQMVPDGARWCQSFYRKDVS